MGPQLCLDIGRISALTRHWDRGERVMNRLGSVLLGAFALVAVAHLHPPSVEAQDSDYRFVGRWEGAAQTPEGAFGLAFELEHQEGSWSGRFMIPSEGVTVPLSKVRTAADSIVLPLAPGRELRGVLIGDSITGALEIQGRVLSVTLGRAGSRTAERIMAETRAAAEAARPPALVLADGGGAAPGVDQEALDRLIAAANEAHSHSVVVLHDGALVGAWHAGGEQRRIETMSVTKSVLNLAVGRLVTLGVIPSIDEPVHAYYPEWREGEKAAITIRHLLNHTSGIHSPRPTAAIYESDDFVRFALEAELVASPEPNSSTTTMPPICSRAWRAEPLASVWIASWQDGQIVGYGADGYLGQYLVIYPEHGLVAVRLVAQSPAYDPETDGFRDFQDLVRSLVSPEAR